MGSLCSKTLACFTCKALSAAYLKQNYGLSGVQPVHPLQVLADFCAEDADVAFGVPEDSLLEIGLPYRLQ